MMLDYSYIMNIIKVINDFEVKISDYQHIINIIKI